MATWLEDTIQALKNLGGVSSLGELYNEVERIREETSWPESADAIIRRTLETYSSDSTMFGGNDIFYSAKGIGKGIWGLRGLLRTTPVASDVSSPPETTKVKSEVYRILRDTDLGRNLKLLYGNHCQICRSTIKLKDGNSYSEAHHIRPLGAPHNGPDIASNIIVLCPNHHVMCDYGVIRLESKELHIRTGHSIADTYIHYHNTEIVKG